MPLKWHVRCDPGEKEPKQVMLRGYLPIGLKGRLPPTEPESWRMGDAPYKVYLRLNVSKDRASDILFHITKTQSEWDIQALSRRS